VIMPVTVAPCCFCFLYCEF